MLLSKLLEPLSWMTFKIFFLRRPLVRQAAQIKEWARRLDLSSRCRDYWARFERFVSLLTRTCEDVYIVTGPLYLPSQTALGYRMSHPMIGVVFQHLSTEMAQQDSCESHSSHAWESTNAVPFLNRAHTDSGNGSSQPHSLAALLADTSWDGVCSEVPGCRYSGLT